MYFYNFPDNTHPHTHSGSNRCEGSREKASWPLLLPGRTVTGNGIPIPRSLLLIHNRPTAGLTGTSADMPASGHILLHTHRHTHRGGKNTWAPSLMCTLVNNHTCASTAISAAHNRTNADHRSGARADGNRQETMQWSAGTPGAVLKGWQDNRRWRISAVRSWQRRLTADRTLVDVHASRSEPQY